jgi:hypothetical protein
VDKRGERNMNVDAHKKKGITFLDLETRSCRAVISEEGETFRFCGDRTVQFYPYCPFHKSIYLKKAPRLLIRTT